MLAIKQEGFLAEQAFMVAERERLFVRIKSKLIVLSLIMLLYLCSLLETSIMSLLLRDFLESGIIEMYCMGIASEDEKMLVETFAHNHIEVREEIEAVNRALQSYASAEQKTPAVSLKEKIMAAILPPLLKENHELKTWMSYLKENAISTTQNFDELFVMDLPSSEKQITYLAWANKGTTLEESHESEDEYLLMLSGSCSITCNGITQLYHKGEIVFIPKNTIHKAVALSNDMLLLGQRIAA